MDKFLSQNKERSVVHVAGKDGKSLCRVENGKHRPLFELSIFPLDKRMCKTCSLLKKKGVVKGSGVSIKSLRKTEKDFYRSWEWLEVRYKVLKKYGPKCMCCGSSHKIVVDHIKPRRIYPELELEEDNLQVLCALCNRGKSYKDETDFRDLA